MFPIRRSNLARRAVISHNVRDSRTQEERAEENECRRANVAQFLAAQSPPVVNVNLNRAAFGYDSVIAYKDPRCVGIRSKIKNLTTPEDIEKWRAERIKRRSTRAKIELQQKAKEERKKRGKIWKRNKNRFRKQSDRQQMPMENQNTNPCDKRKRKRNRNNRRN